MRFLKLPKAKKFNYQPVYIKDDSKDNQELFPRNKSESPGFDNMPRYKSNIVVFIIAAALITISYYLFF